MKSLHPPITPTQSLAELATTRPGASRVFLRHGLDFCCHGQVSLADACARKSLEVGALLDELRAEEERPQDFQRWDGAPVAELIDFILQNFHEWHRLELPRLAAMAAKVERVHREKDTCPRGLAAHLEFLAGELEAHMQKEEQVLFPLIRAGRGRMAGMPIQTMELEHRDHGRHLERTRALATDFVPPAEACGTWRAMYLGLAEFERDVMQHIHLENNVLFPHALRETA